MLSAVSAVAGRALSCIVRVMLAPSYRADIDGLKAPGMKTALKETQTLRAGCNKAEPKIFAPPQTPFPGARDGQDLISWRWSLHLPINPVW